MNLWTLLRMFATTLALVAVILLCSCANDPCEPDDDGPTFSRETREGLLSHLAESFSSKRLDWYEECLDESFTFVPTDRDADSLDLPEAAPWLERPDDMAAIGRMFSDGWVGDLCFTFDQIYDPGDGGEEDSIPIRTIPDIRVEIDCGGGPVNLLVVDSYLDFVMAEDPAHEGLWVIRTMTEIRFNPERTASHLVSRPQPDVTAASDPSTLGYIKSIFLKRAGSKRTVDQALGDYAESIEAKDIETYADCLDFDHRFILLEDVADSMDLPPDAPWWGKTEDVEVMTRMFGEVNVKSISFDYDVVSRDTSWSGGKMLVGVRVWPDIRLLYQAPGEEPFMLWVHDEHMDFKFVGRGSCSDCWAVFSVEEFPFNPTRDKTFGMALTEPSSWGSVKALFAQ